MRKYLGSVPHNIYESRYHELIHLVLTNRILNPKYMLYTGNYASLFGHVTVSNLIKDASRCNYSSST